MSRPKKESKGSTIGNERPQIGNIVIDNTAELAARVFVLEGRIVEVERRLAEMTTKKAPLASINKLEDFNGEVQPPKEDGNGGWQYQEKLDCMRNAAKVLPPNLIKDGRHARENIEAICPFKVTEEMMDDLYAEFKHEV